MVYTFLDKKSALFANKFAADSVFENMPNEN